MNTQTQQLLDNLKAYEQGLLTNIGVANQNGGIINDPLLMNSLAMVPASVPGAQQAAQLANLVQAGIASVAGTYSPISNGVKKIFTQPIGIGTISFVTSIINGRTFQSDQYIAAGAYSYYVLGKNLGQSSNVPDNMVQTALMWYIDKLGVYVSGSEHLDALSNSASAYISLHSVNAYTTTDVNRVNSAVAVMKNYMPHNNVLGYWQNAVGVYDNELVALANQGYKNYYQDLQALKQQANQTPDAINPLTNTQPTTVIPIWVFLLAGLAVLIILIALLK